MIHLLCRILWRHNLYKIWKRKFYLGEFIPIINVYLFVNRLFDKRSPACTTRIWSERPLKASEQVMGKDGIVSICSQVRKCIPDFYRDRIDSVHYIQGCKSCGTAEMCGFFLPIYQL